MNKMKKGTAILLALLSIGTAILTSCSDNGDNTVETTPADSTQTNHEIAETVPPEYTAPDKNYDGAAFTIAAYDFPSANITWACMEYCEAYAEEQNGDVINDAIYERNIKVEEELGIKIGIFSLTSFDNGANQLKTAILAGDDAADIALVNGKRLTVLLGTNGEYLIDLYQLDGVDFSHSWWNQNCVHEFDIFGRLLAVTGDISLYSQYAPSVFFFNKTLANDHSLDNLYDMVREGKWTFDKMVETCRIVSKDIDGNGVMDTADVYGLSHQLNRLRNFLETFDIRISEKDSSGIPQLVLNSERTVKAVEMVIPFLYNDQITIGAHKFKGYNNVFKDLHIPKFKENTILFNFNQLLVTMDLRDMEGDFGIIPAPKFDESQDEYFAPINESWATYLTVPITNADLDMTGAAIESLGYHAQQIITPAYIDITVLNKTLRDTDSEEMVKLVLDSKSYDLARYFDWGGITGLISSLATGNNINFASMWAANENKIQLALDKTFDGFSY